MFSAPEKNIEQLDLREQEIVADFGAGTGAYTLAAAKVVKTGRVYAVDVQKDLLARLQNSCKEAGAGNVSFIWGDIEVSGGTKLKDQSVDVVILSNVLFQTDNKKGVIEEAKRVLRNGGRLFIADWSASFKNMGPTSEQVFPELEARELVESLGFTWERNVDAGNFHYGMIFLRGLYQHRPSGR